MPNTYNRDEDVFAKYNAMSTEELQQILREDASKPEGNEETSMEALFYIMEVLAQRRQARNEGKTPEEALEAFRKCYEEDEMSFQSEREHMVRKRNATTPNWIKRLVATAAIIILIFSSSITAKAFGIDLWEIIVKWTQETFHFGYSEQGDEDIIPEKNDSISYFELHSILKDYHIDVPLAPHWVPDGYIEQDARVIETPKQRQFVAKYENGDAVIKVWVEDYLDGYPLQIEQDESTVEVYELSGVQYYIFSDVDSLQVAWVRDNYACFISGPLSLSEIKQMIDSIEKG